MNVYDEIIEYLEKKYCPEAIILYGSFADGSANRNSDFDALLIYDGKKCHDGNVVGGIVLDVFCYPSTNFSGEYDPDNFLGVFDGKIVLDKNGTAKRLKDSVTAYIDSIPPKTKEELFQETAWCEKMLSRTARGDAEGFFRWHWVLIDSLEIYFDVIGARYYGPKKSLKYMEANDPSGFALYRLALSDFSEDALKSWLDYLKKTLSEKVK